MCQDYAADSEAARKFYQHMQAKLFFAVTSHTPAQLIKERADAGQPHMGLQNWSGDRILQSDVTVGKNYLAEGLRSAAEALPKVKRTRKAAKDP